MPDYPTVIALVQQIFVRRNPYNHHMDRCGSLALPLAIALEFSPYECEMFVVGAHIHDLGKLLIREDVLNLPRKLSKSEMAMVKQHALEGYKVIVELNYEPLICDIVLHHHERFDGNGYPDRLRGEHISKYARAMTMLDVWDALRSQRSYRPAFTAEGARDIMRSESGKVFDPAILEVFLQKVAGE